MKISDVAKLSPMQRFLYWVKERHNIYLIRQEGLPKPWTDDEVLQSWFFTNPYRENDRVTRWFREQIRDPWREDERVVFATVAFRWFNYIPTGQILHGAKLFEDWCTKEALALLRTRQDLGHQVFTGAFNISASGSTKPKINRVCEDYLQPVWEQKEYLLGELKRGAYERRLTLQGMHGLFSELPGLGGSGFMAYEIVCDLQHTIFGYHCPDKLTWSNPGPGAKRGLNRIIGREINAPVSKEFWLQSSRQILQQMNKHLPRMPEFDARTVEHSLCEFDKYERARLGEGHMKRTYDGKPTVQLV